MKALLVMAWLLAAHAQAHAQQVWRCGPEGRSYSDRPCNNEGTLLAVADPRSAADVQAGRDVAAREARLAAQLRQERLKRETPPAITVIKPARTVAGAPHNPPRRLSKAKRRAAEDADTFRAVAPASRQKQG
jgi:hypothetical protein